MKKIIIKYKLKNRDDFEKRVEQEGFDFMPPFWQHERVYVPKNYRKNNSYPRLILRTEMKAVDRPAKYELELRRHIEDSGIDIVETTLIRDYSEVANIIFQLGFVLQKEIASTRQKVEIDEKISLTMEKIENISGYFGKMEREISDDESIERMREKMILRMEDFGQSRDKIITDTYAEHEV